MNCYLERQGWIDVENVKKFYDAKKEDEDLYGSPWAQFYRFASVAKQLELLQFNRPYTLLDIGCGRGDFLDFLKKNPDGCTMSQYFGIDISETMIEQARKMPGHGAVAFLKGTVDDILKPDAFDFVVSIGAFILKYEDLVSTEYEFWTTVEKMFSRCKLGMAVTVQSTYKSEIKPEEFAVDPVELFKFGRQISERVVLDYSFMPHSMTLLIPSRPGLRTIS